MTFNASDWNKSAPVRGGAGAAVLAAATALVMAGSGAALAQDGAVTGFTGDLVGVASTSVSEDAPVHDIVCLDGARARAVDCLIWSPEPDRGVARTRADSDRYEVLALERLASQNSNIALSVVLGGAAASAEDEAAARAALGDALGQFGAASLVSVRALGAQATAFGPATEVRGVLSETAAVPEDAEGLDEAILAAVEDLQSFPARPRTVLVLGDAGDDLSTGALRTIAATAEEAGVRVVVALLPEPAAAGGETAPLGDLAAEVGTEVIAADALATVPDRVTQVYRIALEASDDEPLDSIDMAVEFDGGGRSEFLVVADDPGVMRIDSEGSGSLFGLVNIRAVGENLGQSFSNGIGQALSRITGGGDAAEEEAPAEEVAQAEPAEDAVEPEAATEAAEEQPAEPAEAAEEAAPADAADAETPEAPAEAATEAQTETPAEAATEAVPVETAEAEEPMAAAPTDVIRQYGIWIALGILVLAVVAGILMRGRRRGAAVAAAATPAATVTPTPTPVTAPAPGP
ncbi:hypothetical protein HKCCE2091_21325, partial [Rhodobacterales bacterium HKCCE2091]|nr:hypothetical protein [Rhodobacterales bacterium HKCCE2091]